MGLQTDINAKQLAKMLDKIHPNFAYHMLMLEFSLHSEDKSLSQRSRQTDQITQLTQLYMKAVEILEDAYRPGFQYFNWKIKNLLQRRSVVEELMKQAKSTPQERATTMQAIKQAELNLKRQQHDIRMNLVESPTKNRQKVKDLIKNAEMRLNMIESKIKTGIVEQEDNLNQRIKLRRMKSQSSTKDPLERNQFFQSKKDQSDDEDIDLDKYDKRGRAPGLNKKGRNRHLFASFSNLK